VRLESFSVRNYRSIRQAARVPVRAGVTVLLGPNNEGKSNILRALALAVDTIDSAGQTHRSGRPFLTRTGELAGGQLRLMHRRGAADYDWNRDYPRDLQDLDPSGETVIRLTFALTQQDCLEIAQETGHRITGSIPIELSFGARGVRFRVPKKRWGHELSRQFGPIASFISSRTRLEYIPAVRTHQHATRVIDELLATRLAVLEDDERYVDAVKTITQLQEPVLRQVSEEMTEALQVFLPAVRNVSVELSQDLRYQRLREPSDVIVDDGVPTPLATKGDGVISLAAIGLMRRGTRRSRVRQAILAIEEPESHLHPQAVHLLRDAMYDIARNQQVIITTHSPQFLERSSPSANVLVRANRARPARSLREIRDALGVRVQDNLFSAETVLFVEGTTDHNALQALLKWRSEAMTAALDDGLLAMQPLGGCSRLAASVYAVDRSVMKWHCLLDNDREARECFLRLEHEGLARPAQVTYTVLGQRAESEIEDWYRLEVYKQAFTSRFGGILDSAAFQRARGKWSSRVANAFTQAGLPWCDYEFDAKRLVADCVAAAPADALKHEALAPLDMLIAKIAPPNP